MSRSALAILTVFMFFALGLTLQAKAEGCQTWQIKCKSDAAVHLACTDKVVDLTDDHDSWSFHFDDEEAPFMGVTLTELDPDTAEEAGISPDEGVLINSVYDDTPARQAGLQAGDVITEFAGEKVGNVTALMEMVREHKIGDKVKLKCRRDGKKKTFKVELGKRDTAIFLKGKMPHLKQLFGKHEYRSPKHHQFYSQHFRQSPARLGVEVKGLDKDLADYFPGTDGKGVLVLGVMDDTPAMELGLRAGDVITKLGEEATETSAALQEAVAEVAGEGEVELTFIRKGKRKREKVEIPSGDMAASPHGFQWFSGDHCKPGQMERVFEFHADDDLREKLERLERKLEALEKKLD